MHETILAFDFGRRRIGIAVGQQVTGSANPLGIVSNSDDGPDWREISRLIDEWQPARLIVGMPANADGSRAKIADPVDQFVADQRRFRLRSVGEGAPRQRVEQLPQEQRVEGDVEALAAPGLVLRRRQPDAVRGRPESVGHAGIGAVTECIAASRWVAGGKAQRCPSCVTDRFAVGLPADLG